LYILAQLRHWAYFLVEYQDQSLLYNDFRIQPFDRWRLEPDGSILSFSHLQRYRTYQAGREQLVVAWANSEGVAAGLVFCAAEEPLWPLDGPDVGVGGLLIADHAIDPTVGDFYLEVISFGVSNVPQIFFASDKTFSSHLG
jgi:hypothetical protein